MADLVRVRLYWYDGTVDTAHAPIDTGVYHADHDSSTSERS